MQAFAIMAGATTVESARLSELEQELGIAGFQRPLWDVFIETFEGLSDGLEAADLAANGTSIETVPSLSTMLRARRHRLAVERKGIQDLIWITDMLYRSLTPQQRGRADRLLRPLCAKLACEAASARQIRH